MREPWASGSRPFEAPVRRSIVEIIGEAIRKRRFRRSLHQRYLSSTSLAAMRATYRMVGERHPVDEKPGPTPRRVELGPEVPAVAIPVIDRSPVRALKARKLRRRKTPKALFRPLPCDRIDEDVRQAQTLTANVYGDVVVVDRGVLRKFLEELEVLRVSRTSGLEHLENALEGTDFSASERFCYSQALEYVLERRRQYRKLQSERSTMNDRNGRFAPFAPR